MCCLGTLTLSACNNHHTCTISLNTGYTRRAPTIIVLFRKTAPKTICKWRTIAAQYVLATQSNFGFTVLSFLRIWVFLGRIPLHVGKKYKRLAIWKEGHFLSAEFERLIIYHLTIN